jgi:hypothetical protein
MIKRAYISVVTCYFVFCNNLYECRVNININTERQILLLQTGVLSDHLLTSVHRAVTVLRVRPYLHDMVTASLKS